MRLMAKMNNYTDTKRWDVIIYPHDNIDGSSSKHISKT